MAPRIGHIDRDAPRGRPVRATLDDGEELLLPAAVARELDLHPGLELTSEWLQVLREAESRCARDRALRLLGYRERSVRELERRLGADGYPADVVADTVSALQRLGLVDDARFAAAYVRTRAAAGYGRRRIEQELARAGVDAEAAASALDETLPTDSEVHRARQVLGTRRPIADTRKAVARLVRRGYDLNTAWAAVSVDPAEMPDDSL